MANIYSYWLPPFLLTIGILIMAGDFGSAERFRLPLRIMFQLLPSWPPREVYQLYLMLRKVGHFIAYAALCAAYLRAFRWHMHLSRAKAILAALAICLVISSADEGRQMFYTSRTGSPRDIALDMSGALITAIALFPFLEDKDLHES
jgi:VanZ family protein